MPEYYFDHVHLNSPEPLETAEYYEKMFKARRVAVHDRGNGRVTVSLDLNGTAILISPSADGSQGGLMHFGIRTDNLRESVKELKNSGTKFTQEITEVRPDFKISFLTAPENVTIELQEGSL